MSVALVVEMTAKAGMADELGGFLAGAVELANAEAGTLVWFALRSAAETFWIVDSFPSDAERQAHLRGRSRLRSWPTRSGSCRGPRRSAPPTCSPRRSFRELCLR